MSNLVSFFQSKNIYDYEPVLEGLIDDFGYDHYYSILKWCGIVKLKKEDLGRFWEVFLIKKSEEVIGICGLYAQIPNFTEELWLGWFGVIPSHRGGGIGAKILQHLEIEAKKLGCKKIFSYVDKDGAALGFYYKNDFKRVSLVKEYLLLHQDLAKNFGDENDHVIAKEI